MIAAATLAPKALDGIRVAQDTLEQEVDRLRSTGDPTAPWLRNATGRIRAISGGKFSGQGRDCRLVYKSGMAT